MHSTIYVTRYGRSSETRRSSRRRNPVAVRETVAEMIVVCAIASVGDTITSDNIVISAQCIVFVYAPNSAGFSGGARGATRRGLETEVSIYIYIYPS